MVTFSHCTQITTCTTARKALPAVGQHGHPLGIGSHWEPPAWVALWQHSTPQALLSTHFNFSNWRNKTWTAGLGRWDIASMESRGAEWAWADVPSLLLENQWSREIRTKLEIQWVSTSREPQNHLSWRKLLRSPIHPQPTSPWRWNTSGLYQSLCYWEKTHQIKVKENISAPFRRSMKAIEVPKSKLHLSHDLNISTTHLCCRASRVTGTTKGFCKRLVSLCLRHGNCCKMRALHSTWWQDFAQ